MTPLMFKDAFWVSPFLYSNALLKLFYVKNVSIVCVFTHATMYLQVLNGDI